MNKDMKNKYIQSENGSPIIYLLNEEDVQNVAMEELGRELTTDEIRKLIEPISENIDWSEAISIAIRHRSSLNRLNSSHGSGHFTTIPHISSTTI